MKHDKVLLMWGSALVQSILAFILPVISMLVLVGGFVVGDLICAIAVSIKIEQKAYVWKNIFLQIPKALAYSVVVVSSYSIETYWFPNTGLAKIICGCLAVRELKRIDYKFEIITGFSVMGSVIKLMENGNKKKL